MFAENLAPFFDPAGFGVAALWNGNPINGLASGGYIEPLAGVLRMDATTFECAATDAPNAAEGDTVVIADGEFAGSYLIRNVEPDETRRTLVMRLDEQ